MSSIAPNQQHSIDSIIGELQEKFAHESSGHDWWHIYRVYMMAKTLSAKISEPHDNYVVELAALLHDIADWKFYDGDDTQGPKQARILLERLTVEETTISQVEIIIKEVSFKGADVATPVSTLESAIVQDADRLDAIGAVGIARAFAYGGHKNRNMYDPDQKPEAHDSFESYKTKQTHTINHFYEKLLLLKDRMNTTAAKQIAQARHKYMETFLSEFYDEWEGRK